ncbi:MAG: M48 family metalloprotease [Bdellovibrionales bacterium]|jgi:Zn-dependent peptidase ImmA (M78 family)|nr:M48 family metalloprotease [Bdellovibrionales bacterium]
MLGFKIRNNSQNFIKNFFSKQIHNWIRKDPDYHRAFMLLFDCLPTQIQDELARKKDLIFIKMDGQFASTIEADKKKSIILIYEDLLKLFKGPRFPQGVAVLAHELGHILRNHAKRHISILDSQFEADQFAIEVGFEEELIDFLSDNIDKGDCKIRLENILVNK